jgi:predicted metal-dependent phosphoesterase TrpH
MTDYHIHSIYSDGWYTPEEVLKKADSLGLEIIATTDHDTVAAIPEFMEVAKKYPNIKVIAGCEFSCTPPPNIRYTQLHILALDIKNFTSIEKYTKKLEEKSFRLAKSCVEFSKRFNIDTTFEDIIKSNVGTFTGIDYIRYLAANSSLNINEAYNIYVHGGDFFDVYDYTSPKEEVLEIIRESGAKSVLAHPYRLGMDNEELKDFVKELVDLGLDGIECYHNDHTGEEIEYYLGLAKEFNLIVTGGSDFHGDFGGIEIGHYVTNGEKFKLPSLYF